MGWKMLINDHIIVKRDSSEIAVLGTICCHTWPFPRYLNLNDAYADYDTSKRFIVLLQHTSDVWKLDRFYQNRVIMVRICDKVDLMLAGHTHAMQFMITLFGHSFSPAWFVNEFWGGLYTEGDHKLYVNIGIGMVGMPARLGSAYPEITLITLKKRGGCIVDDKGNRISD
jgi:predicted MPP superfamily phosphohydrolase